MLCFEYEKCYFFRFIMELPPLEAVSLQYRSITVLLKMLVKSVLRSPKGLRRLNLSLIALYYNKALLK